MKKNRMYIIVLLMFCAVAVIGLWLKNDTRKEKALIKEIYPQAKQIKVTEKLLNDPFIQENFPAIQKIYSIDGTPSAFITSGTGYVGTIKTLVVIDNIEKKTLGIKILEQGDTPLYADSIKENWFTDRFKGLELLNYLKLVVLDPEEPIDIVQVTGASVSSQAVLNNVNSAIGAWNYLVDGVKKEPVEDAISQEMWEKDENSFLISWPENRSLRINVEELEDYPQITVDTILHKTTGIKINTRATGPLLKDILEKNGVDINAYEAIGITGRDNYYAMISKEIIQNRDIILATEIDGKELPREEKPIRIVVPDEMGVYWVKMVSKIDLYKQISPKDIQNVHIFDALTKDIEPYYYEYYGSKDKSFLVGKILFKFTYVDPNGFFTMVGSDGLVKNETINVVRDRYYIKSEGENAPMNISPAFKLGMNVKEMSHFSTTMDSAIFPKVMMKVLGHETIPQGKGVKLKEALEAAGMILDEGDKFIILDSSGKEYSLSIDEIESSFLMPFDNGADVIIKNETIKDIQKISKIQK